VEEEFDGVVAVVGVERVGELGTGAEAVDCFVGGGDGEVEVQGDGDGDGFV